MSVKCPVTNEDCPYLTTLDTDFCPREHECDMVRKSLSKIVKRPPASGKTIIIVLSIVVFVLAAVVAAYFIFLQDDYPIFRGKTSEATSTPEPTQTTPTLIPEPTQTPALVIPDSPPPSPSAEPTPMASLPPVPVTGEAATMPVRIEIDGVMTEIRGVPLDENNNIAVLPLPQVISWYEGSYMPGETGNSIMFGYKHFRGISGAFYNLAELQPGDKVRFTLDNGTIIEQSVTENIVFEYGVLTSDILQLENEVARTVLISETGEVNPNTGGYMDLVAIILH